MTRPPSPFVTDRFGPGPIGPAVRALVAANVAGFFLTLLVPSLAVPLGLIPAAVIERLWVWQLVTYMFQHGGLMHLLFNMLALWMFGVDLERLWGTRFFTRYYFVAGMGAGLTTILVSLLPFGFAEPLYVTLTVGASGAIYGLLLAYALTWPNHTIYYIVFPIPAKYFVLIVGAIAFFSSVGGSQSGVAHITHLGGIAAGYLYLVARRGALASGIRSQFLRWRLNRLRKRFNVHDGGRSDGPSRRIH